MPWRGVFLRRIHHHFIHFDLRRRVKRLLRSPRQIALGRNIEIAFFGFIVLLRNALGIRLTRLVRNIHRIARIDHNDIFQSVRNDKFFADHVDDLNALAVIRNGIAVRFRRLADIFIKRGGIRDARPLERCRDQFALIGMQNLGETHRNNGRIGDKFPVHNAQFFAVLHRRTGQNRQKHPRLDSHDPAIPEAALAALGTAGDRLPAHVDEIIAVPRVRRFAGHDRHFILRGDLLDLRDTCGIVPLHQALGGDDEKLFVRIAVLGIRNDGGAVLRAQLSDTMEQFRL